MDFTCPDCSHPFGLPDREMARRTAPVACPRCSATCWVGPTGSPKPPARVSTRGMDDDELARWLARRRGRSRRTVWVLAGDPAIDRPGVAAVLEQMCSNCRLEVLDGPTCAQRAASSTLLDDAPDVLVFGDLHVILQDELLSKLRLAPEVTRVLLSTHHNDDLVDAARAFCTVDRHVVLPESGAVLAADLSAATGVSATLPA